MIDAAAAQFATFAALVHHVNNVMAVVLYVRD
jgi:hypothetical protein